MKKELILLSAIALLFATPVAARTINAGSSSDRLTELNTRLASDDARVTADLQRRHLPSSTPSATPTSSPSASPTPTPIPTSTASASASPSGSPTASPSATPVPGSTSNFDQLFDSIFTPFTNLMDLFFH